MSASAAVKPPFFSSHLWPLVTQQLQKAVGECVTAHFLTRSCLHRIDWSKLESKLEDWGFRCGFFFSELRLCASKSGTCMRPHLEKMEWGHRAVGHWPGIALIWFLLKQKCWGKGEPCRLKHKIFVYCDHIRALTDIYNLQWKNNVKMVTSKVSGALKWHLITSRKT